MYKRLDIMGGILGCLTGTGLALVGFIVNQTGTLEIGVAVLLASIIYLLLRNRFADSSKSRFVIEKSLVFIPHIVFFITISICMYLMHISLLRPPLFFLILSFSVISIVTSIAFNTGRLQIGLLLVEILFVAGILRFGMAYDLYGFYGVDPWVHSGIIEDWLAKGHITHLAVDRFTQYANFPVMHLNIMAMRLITYLSPKDSLSLSVGFFYIVSILFVFLMGRHLTNTKIGLLAALLIGIDIFNIRWGVLLVPTSLGMSFFIVIIWLVLKEAHGPSDRLILILFSLVVVYTHPLAALATALTLTIFFIACKIYREFSGLDSKKLNIKFNLVILFWAFAITTWITGYYSPSMTLLETILSSFFHVLSSDVEFTGGAFTASETSLGILNRMGFLLFVGFSVIGSLFWISRRNSINSSRMAIIASVIFLTIFTLTLPFLNIWNFFPGRWLPFISALCSIIAAEGVWIMSQVFKSRNIQTISLILIMFLYTTFVINCHSANTQAPFYGKDYMQDPQRDALYRSEFVATQNIGHIYQGDIITDAGLGRAFIEEYGVERVRYLNSDSDNDRLITIRNYLYTHQTIKEYSEAKYYDWLLDYNEDRYNRIYNNGEVSVYVKK